MVSSRQPTPFTHWDLDPERTVPDLELTLVNYSQHLILAVTSLPSKKNYICKGLCLLDLWKQQGGTWKDIKRQDGRQNCIAIALSVHFVYVFFGQYFFLENGWTLSVAVQSHLSPWPLWLTNRSGSTAGARSSPPAASLPRCTDVLFRGSRSPGNLSRLANHLVRQDTGAARAARRSHLSREEGGHRQHSGTYNELILVSASTTGIATRTDKLEGRQESICSFIRNIFFPPEVSILFPYQCLLSHPPIPEVADGDAACLSAALVCCLLGRHPNISGRLGRCGYQLWGSGSFKLTRLHPLL